MESLTITAPHSLRARVTPPASKSISNRALIVTALSGAASLPGNLSDCDDTRVMLRALRQRPHEIDIMGAGTAMRFLTAYLAATPCLHTLTGSERMLSRPIGVLVDALRSLGACISYAGREGFPPLRIEGRRLAGGSLSLPGNVSSQYVSALLLIGPTLEGGLSISLTGDVVSRPYIDMTLSIMRQFGAEAEWEGEARLRVEAKPYVPTDYNVEGDWSAASYWYEAVALSDDAGASVSLAGLRAESTQGDSKVRDFFARLGVATGFTAEGAVLSKGGTRAKHLELDLREQPDLAQTLVATCCALGVTFSFSGLGNLRIKETDRIEALRTELAKLGYALTLEGEGTLLWDGTLTKPSPHPSIDTYDDHRMAMALAPCCLRHGALRINEPRVVSKSYPRFWDDLATVGFGISKG